MVAMRLSDHLIFHPINFNRGNDSPKCRRQYGLRATTTPPLTGHEELTLITRTCFLSAPRSTGCYAAIRGQPLCTSSADGGPKNQNA